MEEKIYKSWNILHSLNPFIQKKKEKKEASTVFYVTTDYFNEEID